ncbi:MAG: phosphoribosylformylglycinamidine synthase I [Candidatus Thermoplasmatota archaeon]|nr:phosphoribosylformylglycinamidine synthase I [Candidatus Thermoplasmatota archaeon]
MNELPDKSLRAAILRMEGTNNEAEAYRSFREVGIEPQYVHIWELEHKKTNLEDFNAVFIPGGFSAGDYVRAGAIFALRLQAAAGKSIRRLAEDGVPIIGPCNGFQILAESGIIGTSYGKKDVALDVNESGKFECRTIYVKYRGGNRMLSGIPVNTLFEAPVAHKEGRLKFLGGKTPAELGIENRVAFTYENPEGGEITYPWNPNGSVGNIAGITGEFENVIGLMPHPERIFYDYQVSPEGRASGMLPFGKLFFSSIRNYMSAR